MILVTGGAGVMGSRLVRRLAGAGHRVRALVLPGDSNIRRLAGRGCLPVRAGIARTQTGEVDVEIHEGDVTDPASLAGAFEGAGTVFHLAAVIVSRDPEVFRRVNLEGTRNVVRAAAEAGAEHFVYVSSASVTYRHQTDYSRSKAAAEELVRRERRFAHTIVRPTLVYDRTGGEEIEMFARYLRLCPVVPFIGAGEALKRPVHAGDVIDGLARIPGSAKARGALYNLSGGEAISMIALARLLCRQMRLSRVIVPVPELVVRAGLAALGPVVRLVLGSPHFARQIMSGFTEDADLDPASAARDLGYDPIPASVGIPRYFHVRAPVRTTSMCDLRARGHATTSTSGGAAQSA